MTFGPAELTVIIAIVAAVVIGLLIVEMRRGGRAKVPIARDHDHDHHRIIWLLLLGICGPAGRQGPQGPPGPPGSPGPQGPQGRRGRRAARPVGVADRMMTAITPGRAR